MTKKIYGKYWDERKRFNDDIMATKKWIFVSMDLSFQEKFNESGVIL